MCTSDGVAAALCEEGAGGYPHAVTITTIEIHQQRIKAVSHRTWRCSVQSSVGEFLWRLLHYTFLAVRIVVDRAVSVDTYMLARMVDHRLALQIHVSGIGDEDKTHRRRFRK